MTIKCPECGCTRKSYSLFDGKVLCYTCGRVSRDITKEEWQHLFPEVTDEDWERWFGKGERQG